MDVDSFIRDYRTADRDRIAFASNGKLGPELRDANLDRRSAVCERLRESSATAPDELVRELYDAETAWAQAAWCVHHKNVSFLASELLGRAGEANLRCYLQCMMRGMDAYLSSTCVTLLPGARERAVAQMRVLIEAEGLNTPPLWNHVCESLAKQESENRAKSG